MTLYSTYRRKKLALGGPFGTMSADEGQEDQEDNQLGNAIGTVGALGSSLIGSLSKRDPVGGQQSMGSHIGQGVLSGAAMGAKTFGPVGAAVGAVGGLVAGVFKGQNAKWEGDKIAEQKYQANIAREGALSNATLSADPSTYQGNKGAGYYGFGGLLGTGDPSKDKSTKYRSVTPQLQTEWNSYLDYLQQQGVAGQKALDTKPVNGGVPVWKQHLDSWRKANPQASLDDSWIPDIQADFYNTNEAVKRRAAEKGQTAYLSADPSKFDGWVGSKTSTQRYIPQTTQELHNGQVVRQSNDGLLDSTLTPTGTAAGATAPKRKWGQMDAGVLQTEDGRYIAPDGTEVKGYGGSLHKALPHAAETGAVSAPLARMYMMGGSAKSLSSDSALLNGLSHESGGIDIPGMNANVEGGETTSGDFVFSKRLGFAQQHLPIAKAIGKIEKKPATQERLNTLKLLRNREKGLGQKQELLKRQIGLA